MHAPRRTPVVLLQLANLVSGVGNAVVTLAIPWLVLDVTGSAAAAGIVAAASALPSLVAAPVTGWLIDHLGRRTVSVVADILSAISVAALPLLATSVGLSYGLIFAFAVIGAVFDPAGYSARRAMIPDAAEPAALDVDRLNGIHQGVWLVGWTVGPLFGTWLIASFGAVDAFWIPAGLFVVAAIAVACMRVQDSGQLAREARGEDHVAGGWMRGFTTLWNDHALRALTIAVLVLAAGYLPTETVVLPAHFKALDQPQSMGIVIAALAGGSMVGAFSYGWLAARLRPSILIRLILIGTSLGILPMALLPSLPLLTVFAFLLGLSWGPFDPLMSTLVQQRIPADEHGRVYGVQLAAFYAAPPLGMVLAGFSVDAFGVSSTYLVLGALVTVCSVAVMLLPSVRNLDRRRPN